MSESMIARGLASQTFAALAMLKDCIDRCPEKDWLESHGDYPFSRVVFHALFDCDYHLSDNQEQFMGQAFHANNRESFGDYEELEDRSPRILHDRDFLRRYHEHCVEKVERGFATRTDEELLVPNADIRGNMTKLERAVNVVRHLQHHAAQLGLRLQFITGEEMEWVSRG